MGHTEHLVSPTGIESNPRPSAHRSDALQLTDSVVRSHILGLYVTYVLHTARISNVESVLCVDKEKDGKCGNNLYQYTCPNKLCNLSTSVEVGETTLCVSFWGLNLHVRPRDVSESAQRMY